MDRASQVHAILSKRGLTLYAVSRKSANLFGRRSEFYIPHNLYSVCSQRSPSVCQLLALSQITNYRLADWLLVFGFELDRILRPPLILPRRGTTILDSEVYDPDAWVPWFTERATKGPLAPTAPLGQFVAPAPARRAGELLAASPRKFLYAAIGERDFYALPHFAAGSVIRVDPLRVSELQGDGARFFLIEHSSGWNCSRLVALGQARVLLHCPQRPCLERELKIGRDARILGIVDAEIRPMTPCARIWGSRREPLLAAQPGGLPSPVRGLKDLLPQSRLRAGLSFREASALSRRMAEALRDDLYFAAASTLSDYETLSTPPRQIQKIITLCVLYGIPFGRFLGACGLPTDPGGRDPIPDELLGRPTPEDTGRGLTAAPNETVRPGGFFRMLLDEWQEIPLFLRFSLDELGGSNLTLSDVFWVGGEKAARHSLLVGAWLVALNRRARKLAPHRTAKARCGSLHMVLLRNGDYLCGPCSLEGDDLVVDGYARARLSAHRFRNRIDAEVVGQVTAIFRRLG